MPKVSRTFCFQTILWIKYRDKIGLNTLNTPEIVLILEYKKARAELKKRSTDTLRLQKKKARKGQHLHGQGQSQGLGTLSGDVELNRMLQSSAAVVQEKRLSLEDTERRAVRAALLEERGRFCLLARFLKPVLVSKNRL